MCNLYNLSTNQHAIRDLARVMQDSLGNLEPSLDVYPDRPAPVVRNTVEGRELARLTWGMPTPPQFLKSKDAPDTGVTVERQPPWPVPTTTLAGGAALQTGIPVFRSAPPA